MKYFRNSELTKLYNVSDKSVRNWIEATQQGNLDLELYDQNGKIYIIDSIHNEPIIEELVLRGRKYRNNRSYRRIAPLQRFYELYPLEQIADIINNLEKYREIPPHYRFTAEGAVYWDAYLNKLYGAGNKNMLTATIGLLRLNQEYLNDLLGNYQHINVIDVGVGNGLAVKGLLQNLINTGKLKRYIGIDCSQDLLDITEKNLQDWFGKKLSIEKRVRDIRHERFTDTLVTDSFGDDASSTINLVLFLGGTIGNFREPAQALQTIRESMRKEDILISFDKLDSKNARKFFDFNIEADKDELPLYNRFVLGLLSINDSFYEVEQFFDEKQNSRHVQVKLRVDLTIQFTLDTYTKDVELHKGESVLLTRMWEWTGSELTSLYEKNGFSQLQITKSYDEEYILLVSKVKTGKPIFPIKKVVR